MAGRLTNAERERRRIAALENEGKNPDGETIVGNTTGTDESSGSSKKPFTISGLEQNIDNATLGLASEPKKSEDGTIDNSDFRDKDKDDPDYVPKEIVNPLDEDLIENESDANSAAKKISSSGPTNQPKPQNDFAPPIIDGAAPTSEEKIPPPKKPEPLNPDFDNMTSEEKRLAVELFADAILGNYAEILPIIPKMMAKYDMDKMQLLDDEGNLRLSMVVERGEGGELTIRQHCMNFNNDCDEIFVVTEDMKAELRGPLIQFLNQKGVAPSPLVTLLITVGKHTLTFIIQAMQMQKERESAIKTFVKFRKAELEIEKEEHKTSQFNESPKEPAKKEEKTTKTSGISIEDIVDVEEVKNPKTTIKSNDGGIEITDVVIEEE